MIAPERATRRFSFVTLVAFFLVGAVISSVGQSGQSESPGQQLLRAVEKGDVVAVRRLLDNGAALESTDANGATPLILAAENANSAMVKLLLEKGANLAAEDQNRETPLIHAARNGSAEIVEALVERTPATRDRERALFAAAESGPVAVLYVQGNEARGPQADPAELPWVRTVKVLLDKGVAVDARRDEDNSTPLIEAASHGQLEIVQLLLNKGAQVDAADNDGNTALTAATCECAQATMRSTYEIVRLLLDRGANVNARTHDGTTALMNAAGGFGPTETITLLLARGADAKAKNDDGKTALTFATETQRGEATEALRKAMADEH